MEPKKFQSCFGNMFEHWQKKECLPSRPIRNDPLRVPPASKNKVICVKTFYTYSRLRCFHFRAYICSVHSRKSRWLPCTLAMNVVQQEKERGSENKRKDGVEQTRRGGGKSYRERTEIRPLKDVVGFSYIQKMRYAAGGWNGMGRRCSKL